MTSPARHAAPADLGTAARNYRDAARNEDDAARHLFEAALDYGLTLTRTRYPDAVGFTATLALDPARGLTARLDGVAGPNQLAITVNQPVADAPDEIQAEFHRIARALGIGAQNLTRTPLSALLDTPLVYLRTPDGTPRIGRIADA